ncbi:sortase domain-containing protein [Streptomyces huiliensis]|uniref:sortase domain-containing protein n=1 Tax=Streptomyces huiliensis TaxID=2876027 RepID=UPI001CBC0273|nr:sortase [Streptomyces huiliensis]MBZ4318044.1 sortase [Streptomyces huiliensis]
MFPSHRPALARTALLLAALVLPAALFAGLTGCSWGGIDDSKAVGTPASPDEPQRVRIPSLGVDSPLIRLRTDPHTGRPVRQPPKEHSDTAGWCTGSALPGRPGTAVLVGHREDGGAGGGVFRKLGSLREGAAVEIERGDGKTLRFTVTAVRTMDREEAFATRKEHPAAGSTGPGERALRLVTCVGDDPGRGSGHRVLVVDTALRS